VALARATQISRYNMRWIHTIKLKYLLTEDEDYDSIQKSMNAIADVLDADSCFSSFRFKKKMRNIPQGDEIVTSLDYANKLIDKMYDYADQHRIWIE
jgi:hypothetical protein